MPRAIIYTHDTLKEWWSLLIRKTGLINIYILCLMMSQISKKFTIQSLSHLWENLQIEFEILNHLDRSWYDFEVLSLNPDLLIVKWIPCTIGTI